MQERWGLPVLKRPTSLPFSRSSQTGDLRAVSAAGRRVSSSAPAEINGTPLAARARLKSEYGTAAHAFFFFLSFSSSSFFSKPRTARALSPHTPIKACIIPAPQRRRAASKCFNIRSQLCSAETTCSRRRAAAAAAAAVCFVASRTCTFLQQ